MNQQSKFKVPATPRRKIFAPEKVNRQRNLAIPGPIFWNMIRNPKYAVVTGKLNQTCKYVFWKGKIIPVSYMDIEENNCKIGSEESYDNPRYVNVDLNKISFKLWLKGSLKIRNSEFDSKLLLAHLYRSDLEYFFVGATLQLNIYQKLTASGTLTCLSVHGEIENSDGSAASIDQIFGPLPQLTHFTWHFAKNSSIKTAQDVAEFLGNFAKMRHSTLFNIPEELFGAFADFFKKNKTVDVEIFDLRNLSDNYKQMLEAFMQDVIENPIDKIPKICALGLDPEIVSKYEELSH